MLVKELMQAMVDAYVGKFDSAGVEAWGPAFKQKLERFEGAELAKAWLEVQSSFRPKYGQSFPIPADFEEVLPKLRRVGRSPALDFKGHGERKANLLEHWEQTQKRQIEDSHGSRVGFWCWLAARDRAHRMAWAESPERVRLREEEIDQIAEGVASRDRIVTFGSWALRPGNEMRWEGEMRICRAHVAAGRYTFNEEARVEVRPPMPKPSTRMAHHLATEANEKPAEEESSAGMDDLDAPLNYEGLEPE